jgi:hypothetical protein
MPIPNYQTPGVYVTQTTSFNTGTISPNALNTAFFAYVPSGNAPTNAWSDKFLVTTSGNQTFTLTQSGTVTGFSVVSNTTGFTYAASGIVSAVASGFNVSSAVTSSGITQFTVSGIAANTWISANYNYPTALYGQLYTFTNFNDVQTAFGPAFTYNQLTGTSVVNSPNTLAAYLAFLNGSQVVSCMNITAVSGGTTGEFMAAIQSTTNTTGIDIIVPLKFDNAYSTSGGTNGSLFYSLQGFLNAQAAQSVYQRAFIGLDGTVGNGSTQNLINTCQAITSNLNSSRMSLMAPQTLGYNPATNGNAGTVTGITTIDGYYLAAAAAGLLSGQSTVATPITNKYVQGFAGIPNQISVSDSNTLQSFGTTVVRQDRFGNITVRQGLTTNTTNWLTQEISISAIGDQLAKNLTNGINSANIIGSPLTPVTLASLQSTVGSLLTDAKNSGLITAYNGVTYSQNPNNPTQVNVRFQYSPTIPLNYVSVVFSINSSTGTITFQ